MARKSTDKLQLGYRVAFPNAGDVENKAKFHILAPDVKIREKMLKWNIV